MSLIILFFFPRNARINYSWFSEKYVIKFFNSWTLFIMFLMFSLENRKNLFKLIINKTLKLLFIKTYCTVINIIVSIIFLRKLLIIKYLILKRSRCIFFKITNYLNIWYLICKIILGKLKNTIPFSIQYAN